MTTPNLFDSLRELLTKEWLTSFQVENELMFLGHNMTNSSVTARIRDLRKPQFGRHTVSRRWGGKYWEYHVEEA